jgi:hypothetical protein
MKLTGSKGERIAALVLGGFLLLVQLPRIPKLPLPFTAETLGYDAVWALITGAGCGWCYMALVWFERRLSEVLGRTRDPGTALASVAALEHVVRDLS